MQPLDPTINSTWLAPTQTAITKGNAKLLQDNLADDATLADQLKTWQQEINSDSEPTVQEPLKKAFALWMKDAEIPTSIQTILAKDPTAKVPSYITGYLALDPKDPASVASYKTQLTKEFGGLKNNKGESLINTDLIDAVASGSADFNDLGNQIITAVQTATNKSLGSSASQFSDITNSPTYKSLLNDPSKLTDSYNTSVAKLTKNADTDTWEVGTSGASGSDITGASGSAVGPNGEYQYNGGINQLLNKEGDIDPTLLNQVLTAQQKNVNANNWHAPVYDPATGKYVSNTSPYSVGLTNMLNGYQATGDFYSPGYVNSLANKQPAAMSSEGIASLKSTFTDPKTSTDLLNLANSVGTDYANGKNPITAGSKLSPTLIKQYQPSTITNAAGKTSPAAKPGAPDLSNTVVPTTTIPAIDTKTPLIQIKDTSTTIPEWKRLGYTSEAAYADAIAKKAAADAKAIADADAKALADANAKALADAKAAADAAKQSGIAALNKSWVDHGNASYIDVGSKQELANYLAWNGPNHTYAINGQVVIDKGKVVDPSVAGLVTQTSSPDTTNIINQRNNALGFLKVNGDNPAMAAQIANAKAQLDGFNQQLQAIDPTLVTTYTPVDHAANIKSLQQQQQSIMTQMNNARTDAELSSLQKQLAAVNGQMNFEDITKVAYWDPTKNPYLGTNPTTVVNNPVTNTVVDSGKSSAGNGIATNTGGFTSASNMNTNATGTNGAAGITSVLPQPTGTPIYLGPDPNQVNLTMAPNNQPAPVNNTPQNINLSGAANNPAVLNITNAQQQPVNNTPNYATGLTVNTSPINAGAPNTNQVSLTMAPQFTQDNYVSPETRNAAFFQNIAANNPTVAAAAAWSAQQDAANAKPQTINLG